VADIPATTAKQGRKIVTAVKMNRMLPLFLAFQIATPALAQGLTFSPGPPREYSYPANPQYQYPVEDSSQETKSKCPKGQEPWQGKCRVVIWLR
jgi:hypothetical protein